MKSWKKCLISLLAVVLLLSGRIVYAQGEAIAPQQDPEATPTDGKAYAVLTSDGRFIFFRSTNTYTNNTDRTVTDLYGNSYSGTVYAGFETATYSAYGQVPWYANRIAIHEVYVAPNQIIRPKSTSFWFYKCLDMHSFDPQGFDTSNVTDMNRMFYQCRSLETLPLDGFDTSNVVSMTSMFRLCSGLTTIDLGGFDTSSVTDMSYMFAESGFLYSLDLSHFDTSKVTNMTGMFRACLSLHDVDLSSFDSSAATSMDNLFFACNDLWTVRLGKKWTKWIDEAYLPEGTWKNHELGLAKSETQLYEQYPSRASEWKGYWTRGDENPQEPEDHIRIYRESRLQESIKVADELKEVLEIGKFENIIIAKDSDFADALSGSYLAARKNAPILLVGDSGYEDAYDYIYRNLEMDGTVYILGSFSAVSEAFEDGLDDSDKDIKRLQGSSRYLTNLEILKEAGMTSTGDIFVVTGASYADSLSSASVGLPILMVDNNSTSLKNSQKKFLAANVTGKVYILGDTNAVNASLAKQLKTYGPVTRIGGASRWETTKLIAEKFFPSPDYVTLATGNDFADGLIASPLAYALQSPLLMCASNKTYQAKLYVEAHPVTKAYIVGSKGNISDEAARKILLLEEDAAIVER